MGSVVRYLNLLFLFVAGGFLFAGAAVAAADAEEEILVGRIAHVEGKLLRYIEEEKDWVITVKDSPFGLEDALYSGEDAKAEFIMPNRTWLRIGENTQLQLISLNFDTTTVDIASGLGRFYNKSDDAIIKVSTPFGYVVAPSGAAFDLYVGDDSLEVIAVRGAVDFVHDGSSARYEVQEGSSSIIANASEVAHGNGSVDADWDDWNDERDALWARRFQKSEPSAAFLPEAIREESHVFEENGRWERVYYEGEYRDMWRPTRVQVGWRPFTAGRWTVYYGDNCWIPDEPFGYVTHHYGSWIYIESSRVWFWAPPAPRVAVAVPGFFIGFGWYPGRVGWIHSGPSIGWVPLAPSEQYYGYRSWGRRTVVVTHSPAVNISINLGRYRYLDEAVVVNRDHFYRGSSYAPVAQRNLNRDIIINNYRPVTVINNTVINNFEIDRHRFTYNDVEVARKPHTTVVNRINDNHRTSRGFEPVNRQRIERDLKRFRPKSEPPSRVEVQRPMLTSKIVPTESIAKPIRTLDLQPKDIKPQERERRVDRDKRRPPQSPEREKVDQPRESAKQEDSGRSKLPPGFRGETVEQMNRKRDLLRPPEEGRDAQDKRTRTPQQEAIPDRPEVPQRPEALLKKKPREEGPQQEQMTGQRDDQPRLRSPRDKGKQQTEQVAPSEERVRPPEEIRLRQEQRLQRQRREEGQLPKDQEVKPPQRQDDKRRQDQDLQGQQQEEKQIRQKQEKQRLQQEEAQRQQNPEVKPPQRRQDSEVKLPQRPDDREIKERQNQDDQRRKEQDLQRQQQEGQQIRQKQEKQGLQQDEAQRRQDPEVKPPQRRQDPEVKLPQRPDDQEIQQRQKQDDQRRKEQDLQGQQQEAQQIRQKAEKQRIQQEEGQRQQEQEVKQRQKQDDQRRQEQDLQRQQQEAQQIRQKQEKQRQQQEEGQRQQEQEVKQRQKQDDQRRQEQDQQRQQQEAQQIRQKQEKQRQQQEEGQRQQEQEVKQRQRQDDQRRQEQDQQRQQQEAQQVRQKQEKQRQQQEDGKRQQEQEMKQRQRQDDQRRQEQEVQRQQQEQQVRQRPDKQRQQQEAAENQAQQEAAKKKKKKQTEEEKLLEQQGERK